MYKDTLWRQNVLNSILQDRLTDLSTGGQKSRCKIVKMHRYNNYDRIMVIKKIQKINKLLQLARLSGASVTCM